jgi:hypothetical protein
MMNFLKRMMKMRRRKMTKKSYSDQKQERLLLEHS